MSDNMTLWIRVDAYHWKRTNALYGEFTITTVGSGALKSTPFPFALYEKGNRLSNHKSFDEAHACYIQTISERAVAARPPAMVG